MTEGRSRTAHRWLGPLTAALLVGGLGLGGAAVASVAGTGGGEPAASGPAAETPTPTAAPRPTPRPTNAPEPTSEPPVGDLVDAAWLGRASEETGIPRAALSAYAGAALRTAQEQPGCGLGWNTLAAIGLVESAHGTAGGSALDAEGVAVPPITGPALDGTPGRAAIADTDGGALDGDPRWDRAVGPMQVLPQTWTVWAADGDGDGTADPQDVADAALAAARYLCAAGDLSDPGTWIAAIASYNTGSAYNLAVAEAADRYAAAAALNG